METEWIVNERAARPRWASIPLDAYAAQLPVVRRRVVLSAAQDLALPAFRGALWHSVVGKALKELVCTVPPGVCEGCRRRAECAYPRVTEAASPETADGPLGRGLRLPGPLIFDTGPWQPARIPGGEAFFLDFAIVGRDEGLATAVEQAVERAAAGGLGRRRASARVLESRSRPGLAAELDRVSCASPGTVELRLVSPLRLKRRGAFLRRFDLPALARDLSLRLAALGHKGLARRSADAGGKARYGGVDEVAPVAILDGLPFPGWKVQRDVMTPHFGDWYQNKRDRRDDTENPVPIPFLSVAAGSSFEVALVARRGQAAASHLEALIGDLRRGLDERGLGAKTAAGYGVFDVGALPLTKHVEPGEAVPTTAGAGAAVSMMQPEGRRLSPIGDGLRQLIERLKAAEVNSQHSRLERDLARCRPEERTLLVDLLARRLKELGLKAKQVDEVMARVRRLISPEAR